MLHRRSYRPFASGALTWDLPVGQHNISPVCEDPQQHQPSK
jgi:hypothetical protein